jgi:branched-chain amino acid transport system permease protein
VNGLRLPPGVAVRAGAAAAAAAVLALPWAASAYVVDVGTLVLVYVMLGLGLNMVVGYAGLLDLGYAAFFAIGAYTTAIMMVRYHTGYWATIPVAALLTTVSGAVIGAPTLRMRSDYLAIVTLGFGEIVRITATNLSFTGGPDGVWGIPRPVIGGLVLGSGAALYYLALALATLVLFGTYNLAQSRIGRAWLAIREDEAAARAAGINPVFYKLLAYMSGAFFGGIAGSFFAVKLTAIDPTSFTFVQSVNVLMVVVLGGMGSIPGVILGAVVIVALPEVLRGVEDFRMLAFGLGLIVLMLLRPQGLWPRSVRSAPARPAAAARRGVEISSQSKTPPVF